MSSAARVGAVCNRPNAENRLQPAPDHMQVPPERTVPLIEKVTLPIKNLHSVQWKLIHSRILLVI